MRVCRLEGAHVFRRRAKRQTHLDAVAGAAVVAWKRNVQRLGKYRAKSSALAPKPPEARIIFRAVSTPSFVATPVTAPLVSCCSDNTGVENRTWIFFPRSTAAKRKSVMVLSAFHECDRCAP